MIDLSEFALGPERELAPDFLIHYYSGGPADKHDVALLLRASGRACEHYTEICVERHVILRYTPCGAWIDTYAGERFVNLRSTKQWASVTEAEAIDQLYHRKQSEVRILESLLGNAREVKKGMEQHLGKKPRAPRRYVPDYEY